MTEKLAEKIALVGATGAIGKSVADALRKQGSRYRVIGRSRSTLQKTFGNDPLAEVVTWDPENDQAIRQSLKGAGAIVYMVGVPYTDFQLHPILMRRVLDAAIAENVDRLLLMSGSLDYSDLVSCAHTPLNYDSQVSARSYRLDEAVRKDWIVHPNSKPPARDSQLGNLKNSGSDFPTLSEERIINLDAFRCQIFAKLAVCKRSAVSVKIYSSSGDSTGDR